MITKKEWELIAELISFSIVAYSHVEYKGTDSEIGMRALHKTILETIKARLNKINEEK